MSFVPDEPPVSPRADHLRQVLPFLLMLLLGMALASWFSRWQQRRLHDPAATPRPVDARGDLAEDEQATIRLFHDQSPSVVFITTAQVRIDEFTLDEMTIAQGAGSGFIWDADGYIVTNDHVIASASLARVTLADQSTWDARVVGRASSKDLAVLKIDAPGHELPAILLGQSSDLQVGQKVFAIGNPFGLDYTLTTGVISALDRRISSSEKTTELQARRTIDGVIQTDAAINPGNSGGPLLDSSGRLIGVNTAIYSPSGAYAGVGFAIPVDTVNRIVPELIRHGRIIRPDLGFVPFADSITQKLGLTGVLVRGVYPDSPAAAADLRPTQAQGVVQGRRMRYEIRLGDLIVAADETPIRNLDDWFTMLENHRVGDQVVLKVIRNARTTRQTEVEVTVQLDESRWP
jgi:S1-C subfamily serine protease